MFRQGSPILSPWAGKEIPAKCRSNRRDKQSCFGGTKIRVHFKLALRTSGLNRAAVGSGGCAGRPKKCMQIQIVPNFWMLFQVALKCVDEVDKIATGIHFARLVEVAVDVH
jgi:hypothetical protein